jgi:hypothetical protein
MADQVQGSVTGGNGERLELRMGTKTLGLQTRDLIPILLLIGGMVGGYLIYTSVNQSLLRQEHHHEFIQSVLQQNMQQAVSLIRQVQEDLDEHRRQFRKLLQVHDWNQGREPQDRLPLEVPLPDDHKQQ